MRSLTNLNCFKLFILGRHGSHCLINQTGFFSQEIKSDYFINLFVVPGDYVMLDDVLEIAVHIGSKFCENIFN